MVEVRDFEEIFIVSSPKAYEWYGERLKNGKIYQKTALRSIAQPNALLRYVCDLSSSYEKQKASLKRDSI